MGSLKLVVAGCVAAQEGAALLRRVPELDLVMGPHHEERVEALGGEGKTWLLTEYASGGRAERAVSDPLNLSGAMRIRMVLKRVGLRPYPPKASYQHTRLLPHPRPARH